LAPSWPAPSHAAPAAWHAPLAASHGAPAALTGTVGRSSSPDWHGGPARAPKRDAAPSPCRRAGPRGAPLACDDCYTDCSQKPRAPEPLPIDPDVAHAEQRDDYPWRIKRVWASAISLKCAPVRSFPRAPAKTKRYALACGSEE